MSDEGPKRPPALTRREIEKLGLAAGISLLAGCPSDPMRVKPPRIQVTCEPAKDGEVDYVVVGSGAAGGPLACNLARAGHKVVLLEAGGDPTSWSRDVPALHAESVEDPELRWDFFVRTYADEAQQRRNGKYVAREGGVEFPGVGKNLQDRYEIGVVSEMANDFEVLAGAKLRSPDPALADPAMRDWWFERKGPYTTNGIVGALIKKSKPSLPLPDLFMFGLVGKFKGYYPGFSRDLESDHHHFTWGVLKGHTRNTGGEVRLASADPRDRPLIDFHYFKEASAGGEEDLEAVVEGVLSVRRIMAELGSMVRASASSVPPTWRAPS